MDTYIALMAHEHYFFFLLNEVIRLLLFNTNIQNNKDNFRNTQNFPQIIWYT